MVEVSNGAVIIAFLILGSAPEEVRAFVAWVEGDNQIVVGNSTVVVAFLLFGNAATKVDFVAGRNGDSAVVVGNSTF